eukprot:TRINITY_DN7352_c1_g1_i1.p1 TRINITY_DN7352_c1_g1~~TRINITY_DN7352_c1_g1_i1.p1  ORF type:complete len:559 (-),score=188.37 TRINITY_DN7352_c1_g1_i1:240-1841(-)
MSGEGDTTTISIPISLGGKNIDVVITEFDAPHRYKIEASSSKRSILHYLTISSETVARVCDMMSVTERGARMPPLAELAPMIVEHISLSKRGGKQCLVFGKLWLERIVADPSSAERFEKKLVSSPIVPRGVIPKIAPLREENGSIVSSSPSSSSSSGPLSSGKKTKTPSHHHPPMRFSSPLGTSLPSGRGLRSMEEPSEDVASSTRSVTSSMMGGGPGMSAGWADSFVSFMGSVENATAMTTHIRERMDLLERKLLQKQRDELDGRRLEEMRERQFDKVREQVSTHEDSITQIRGIVERLKTEVGTIVMTQTVDMSGFVGSGSGASTASPTSRTASILRRGGSVRSLFATPASDGGSERVMRRPDSATSGSTEVPTSSGNGVYDTEFVDRMGQLEVTASALRRTNATLSHENEKLREKLSDIEGMQQESVEGWEEMKKELDTLRARVAHFESIEEEKHILDTRVEALERVVERQNERIAEVMHMNLELYPWVKEQYDMQKLKTEEEQRKEQDVEYQKRFDDYVSQHRKWQQFF